MRSKMNFVMALMMASLLVVSTADAKTSKKSKKAKQKATANKIVGDRPFGKPQLGTDHKFTALDVNGRYQYPAEAGVTVEDEKGLTDLLGVRKHFKDRLALEETRN